MTDLSPNKQPAICPSCWETPRHLETFTCDNCEKLICEGCGPEGLNVCFNCEPEYRAAMAEHIVESSIGIGR